MKMASRHLVSWQNRLARREARMGLAEDVERFGAARRFFEALAPVGRAAAARLKMQRGHQKAAGRAAARVVPPAPRPVVRLPIAVEVVQAPQDGPRMTRGECVNGVRPCPLVSCRHHLAVDVSESGGISISGRGQTMRTLYRRGLEDEDAERLIDEVVEMLSTMPDTCSLDVADRGGVTLEEVGGLLGVTRERVRQIELNGLRQLRKSRHLHPELDDAAP